MKDYDDPTIFARHIEKLIGTTPRERALKNGDLRSATHLACELGFLCPVHLTAAAWREAQGDLKTHLDTRQVWDLLAALRFSARGAGAAARVDFQVLMPDGHDRCRTLKLKAVCGPGETTPSVITIMLPHEDKTRFANDAGTCDLCTKKLAL